MRQMYKITKTMIFTKKHLLIAVCAVLLSLTAVSQPYKKGTTSVSLGGELLVPERSLNKSHLTGAGTTIKGEYVFGEHSTATIASGYYFMNGKKTASVHYEDVSAIPVKGGLRYYLGNFYGSGEAGAIFLSDFNRGIGFVYSVGLGDKIRVGNNMVDITLRHEAWQIKGISKGMIALRLGYEFSVSKQQKRDTGF